MAGGTVLSAPDEVDTSTRSHGYAFTAFDGEDRKVDLQEAVHSRKTVFSLRSEASPVDDESQVEFRVPVTEKPQGTAHELRASLGALGQVRRSKEPADWLVAAATLKRDAVRLRGTALDRHSSVLLALADALTFTEPDEPTLSPGSSDALNRGVSLLIEPFVAEPDEENFLVEMMEAGWNLAPSADLAPLPL
jgi:hypothetical protein